MEKFIINIGRQLGSGGKAIGEMLSEEFGIPVYDRKLIDLAAQESGFKKDLFEDSDEKRGFFNSLFGDCRFSLANGSFFGSCLSEESLFQIQSDVIRKLAERESCIFVGRCADYILRDEPRCFNIFITADLADRVGRLRARCSELDEQQALDLIQRTDRKRAAYYNYYSCNTWGAASTYHLCINSSLFGLKGTAEFIKQLLQERFGR